MRWIVGLGLLVVLAGCALRPASAPPAPAPPQPPSGTAVTPATPATPATSTLPHYRCDNGLSFDARFGDGSVDIAFANREPETLLRDAGGASPEVRVYSSTKAKAEFGLEPDGRGARLNLLDPLVETRCVRS